MVNLITGLSFIQAMGMILDMTGHVAELKTLDAPSPFPIEYCCTTIHVPIMNEPKIRVSTADYKPVPVVKLIDDL